MDNLELLKDANIELSVRLGQTKKTVKEILMMGEGTIVELDRDVNHPVDVFVNNKLFARGTVVACDENYAVKVTEIVKS
jgi:flagellar motor switch protein FliN/FliY